MSPKQNTLVLILILLLVLAGVSFWQSNKVQDPEPDQTSNDFLTDEEIDQYSASGEITFLGERHFEFETGRLENGEFVTSIRVVNLDTNVEINELSADSELTPISFADLRIGDRVIIETLTNPFTVGSIQAYSVVVDNR